MEAFIRNLSLESLSGFIQAQVYRRDNGIIFICLKMRQGSRFACRVMKTKNPAGARFFQGYAVGFRRTHCVTSTHKVYAIGDERAISGTDFDVMEYGSPVEFCLQIPVHAYSIYLY